MLDTARSMTPDELQTLIEDATFDHAIGDAEAALAKLAPGRRRGPGFLRGLACARRGAISA